MRIALTGASGYFGSIVGPYLRSVGHDVIGIDRRPAAGPYPTGFIQADIVSGAYDWAEGPWDIVVHLAAIVGEDACKADPLDAERTNVRGTLNLLSSPAKRVIMASTCSNYGVNSDLAVEDSPFNPLSLYAETKIAAERAVLRAGGTVLRFATLCGPSPRMRYDLMVNELALSCVRREPFVIRDPNAWRPFVHIADAARAIEAALSFKAAGQAFNIVGDNLRKGALAQIARARFPAADIRVENGSADKRNYRVNGTFAGNWLGFWPAHSIGEAFNSVADEARRG